MNFEDMFLTMEANLNNENKYLNEVIMKEASTILKEAGPVAAIYFLMGRRSAFNAQKEVYKNEEVINELKERDGQDILKFISTNCECHVNLYDIAIKRIQEEIKQSNGY